MLIFKCIAKGCLYVFLLNSESNNCICVTNYQDCYGIISAASFFCQCDFFFFFFNSDSKFGDIMCLLSSFIKVSLHPQR